MIRRIVRWSGYVLLVLTGLLLLGGLAGWLWLRTGTPQLNGTIALAGLSGPVSIARDEAGVPFIKAGSEPDALFALGFVHAQDRFAQMELTRRTGAGRLAEVLGSSALPVDRFMRTMGLYRLAEADAARLEPDMAAATDAYVAGVNAWLGSRRGALPWELEVLRIAPEPWKRADSLVWGRLMGLRLSGNWGAELTRARLAKKLPPDRLKALYPDLPADSPVTLAMNIADDTLRSMLALSRRTEVADGGSNGWVVSGSRTLSGKPVLANDPHLAINAPILWYLARIDAPGLTLAGATVPGVPVLLLGRNARLAWGMTTTHSDAADLFIEKLDPANVERYMTPQGSVPFVTRTETIQVRFGTPVPLTVRTTRHGPVISDATEFTGTADDPGTVLALSANFLQPDDRSATALHRMGRARDWPGFVAAMENLHAPQQNIFYADVDGHIGLYSPARIPIRRAGDGTVPAPGWTGTHDWAGWIPFAELPHAFDPPSGQLVNANNRIAPPGYPHFLGAEWPEPQRAERINDVLAATAKHGPADARRLQMDVLSPHELDLFRPLIAAGSDDARRAQALRLLAAWDGAMRRDRPEPLIAAAWLRAAYPAVFADDLGDELESWMGANQNVIARVIAADPSWCDDIRTVPVESCDAQLLGALDAALDGLAATQGADMARWRWGDVHQARFSHAIFGRIPWLRDLTDITIANDGGNLTLNRAGTRLLSPHDPYTQMHGPGLRAVYDLADLDASEFSMALGQSESPFSPHHRDLLEPWRDGVYRRLVAPVRPAHTLILQPR